METFALDTLLTELVFLYKNMRGEPGFTDEDHFRFNYCIDSLILEYEKKGYYSIKSFLKKNKIILDEIDTSAVDFLCGESCYSGAIPFVTIKRKIIARDPEYLYPYYIIKEAVKPFIK